MSRGIEVVPGSVDLLPAYGHFAGGLVHIIFIGAVTLPSSDHTAICMKIIVPSVELEPSGHHLAAAVKIVPVIINDCPA